MKIIFISLIVLTLQVNLLGQNTVFHATDFISVSKTATCKNDVYAVFTISNPKEKQLTNLSFCKLIIFAPEGYKIEYIIPDITQEKEPWEQAANNLVVGVVTSVANSLTLNIASTVVSTIEPLVEFWDKHKYDNITQITFTFTSPSTIGNFQQSYLVHFTTISNDSKTISSIPVHLEYQNNKQMDGTLMSDYQSYISICNSLQKSAVDLSGNWEGTLFQKPNKLFKFSMKLTQNGLFISGISKIETENYYGIMSLNGSISDYNFQFNELKIVENHPGPGYYWCLKKGELKLDINSSSEVSLNGNWTAPSCMPGTIVLLKNKKY